MSESLPEGLAARYHQLVGDLSVISDQQLRDLHATVSAELRRRWGSYTASLSERNQEIIQKRLAGRTLEAIAADYNITRERVRQIVAAADGPSSAVIREIRYEQQIAKRMRTSSRLRELLPAYAGSSREEFAAAAGVTVRALRTYLTRADLAVLVDRKRTPRVTDEEMLDWLRKADTLVGGPLTGPKYNKVRDQFGGLSSQSIAIRFGKWSTACALAGVDSVSSNRTFYERFWSDSDCLDAVGRFFDDVGPTGTAKDYDKWARGRDGVPSGALIRHRVGPWAALKKVYLKSRATPRRSA